jgi:hypothetical protein
MPRRPRLATCDIAYHVLNRRVGERAEHWPWSSLSRFVRADGKSFDFLSQWPMERPDQCLES